MSANRAATRYAKALYLSAEGKLDEALADQVHIEEILPLFTSPEVGRVLKSPVVPNSIKSDVLKYALEKSGASKRLHAFIQVLIEARRINLLPEIAVVFEAILDQVQGKAHVDLEAASSLPDTELSMIQKTLEKVLGKKVTLTQQVLPDLLGGFVVRSGHLVVDMSLKTKLEQIAEQAVQ